MAIFSIVEAANANSLDPRKYLQYLLDKRSDSEMTDEELEQFLPCASKVKSVCNKMQRKMLAFPTASNSLSEILLGNAPKLGAY